MWPLWNKLCSNISSIELWKLIKFNADQENYKQKDKKTSKFHDKEITENGTGQPPDYILNYE